MKLFLMITIILMGMMMASGCDSATEPELSPVDETTGEKFSLEVLIYGEPRMKGEIVVDKKFRVLEIKFGTISQNSIQYFPVQMGKEEISFSFSVKDSTWWYFYAEKTYLTPGGEIKGWFGSVSRSTPRIGSGGIWEAVR